MVIDVKKLADLPHGQAEKVLKESGNWQKHEYTFRIMGYYDPEPEAMTVKVMAIDLYNAEIAAEDACDFDVICGTELIDNGD